MTSIFIITLAAIILIINIKMNYLLEIIHRQRDFILLAFPF